MVLSPTKKSQPRPPSSTTALLLLLTIAILVILRLSFPNTSYSPWKELAVNADSLRTTMEDGHAHASLPESKIISPHVSDNISPQVNHTEPAQESNVGHEGKGGVHPEGESHIGHEPHDEPRVIGGLELWAQGPKPITSPPMNSDLGKMINVSVVERLRELCGRCLYRTLTSYLRVADFGRVAIVLTGDIPAMWTRDSAVQMASYLPRVARRPAIRYYIEGAIRAQAYFILQDPWANAYNPAYVPPSRLTKNDRMLGRGGWVWTRNFELDSVAYFFNFLWNFHQTPSIHRPSTLLSEPQIYDATVTLLRLLETEQHHEEKSPYRYSELPREGLGPPCGYTGMVWSAFRPSDDPQVYSYNIPDNAYLVGSLLRLLKLNEAVWSDPYIHTTARRLADQVHDGIQKYGIIKVANGVKMYAYEVDGLGKSVTDFDDPNLPSLLALPLLGYEGYDRQVYENTRRRILSPLNKFYFVGSKLKGMGSPHTPGNYIWPLATAVEALTSDSLETKAESLRMLIQMAEGPFGLPHESVDVSNTQATTRNEFGWASAIFVVAVEQLLPGIDCDAEAEAFRLREIETREAKEKGNPFNKGRDRAWYYSQLEADVIHSK